MPSTMPSTVPPRMLMAASSAVTRRPESRNGRLSKITSKLISRFSGDRQLPASLATARGRTHDHLADDGHQDQIEQRDRDVGLEGAKGDRKSTRLNYSH